MIGDNSKFVMTEESPEVPDEGDTKSVKDKYERWQAANNKARYYMLTSMVDTLKTKMENVETAYEIMDQLQDMFGAKSAQTRFEATKKYANARMAPSQHVRDHLIKMTNYIQEAELHGVTIDEETQVGLILNSLSPAFLPFTTNYVLNKLNYGLTQLMNELQTFESIMGGPSKGGEKKTTTTTAADPAKAEANQVSSSKARNKRKGGQNNNPKPAKASAQPSAQTPKGKKQEKQER